MSKKWVFGWFVAGVITGLAAVSVFYTLIFPGPEIVATDEELAELRQIEKSNPEADAISALRHGDRRLLSVMGFAEHVPVATGDVTGSRIPAKHGVRMIKGTTDCIRGKEQFRLQPIAHEYARKYNCVILREAAAGASETLKPN
ncbi:MAG: hypothetical protein WC740_07870 [Verrucomicrobiia bacterium]